MIIDIFQTHESIEFFLKTIIGLENIVVIGFKIPVQLGVGEKQLELNVWGVWWRL
jgi:hypothetical protein